jgi:hypothetical protein
MQEKVGQQRAGKPTLRSALLRVTSVLSGNCAGAFFSWPGSGSRILPVSLEDQLIPGASEGRPRRHFGVRRPEGRFSSSRGSLALRSLSSVGLSFATAMTIWGLLQCSYLAYWNSGMALIASLVAPGRMILFFSILNWLTGIATSCRSTPRKPPVPMMA